MCIHPFLGEQGVQVDCRLFGWGGSAPVPVSQKMKCLGAAVWGYMAHRCPGFS